MKKEESKKDNLALYRKYRGRKLTDIVGQDHVTSSLAKSLKSGNISHAYLFSGPRGTGKTSVARILAHLVNDFAYSDDSTHLDIIEIDAASNRRIDDMRDLREKVHIAPVQARFKVYIIDEVHMLTNDSFNALLKTLEEPPQYVIFILATTEPHKLPETIISRTQHYQFRPMNQSDAAKHLEFIAKKENLSYDDEALNLLAEHGRGSMRDSVSMLDQVSGSGQKITTKLIEDVLGLVPITAITDLISNIKSGDVMNLESKLSAILAEGVDANALANQIYKVLRSQLSNNPADSASTVDLMRDLLEVSRAYNSYLQLETILLKHALKNSPPSTKIAKSAALSISTKTEKTVLDEPEITNKATDGEIDSSALIDTVPLDDHTWQQIIEDIKKTNNTLAGLLRQTRPQLNGQALTIVCPYSFHVKRLSTSAYLARITKVVSGILGDNIVINVFHRPGAGSALEEEIITITEAPEDEDLKSIQNIMGGGEIINV